MFRPTQYQNSPKPATWPIALSTGERMLNTAGSYRQRRT